MHRDYFAFRDWAYRWKLAKAEILGRLAIVDHESLNPIEASEVFYKMGNCPFCDVVAREMKSDVGKEPFKICDVCKVRHWCFEWSDEDDSSKFRKDRIQYYIKKLLETEV